MEKWKSGKKSKKFPEDGRQMEGCGEGGASHVKKRARGLAGSHAVVERGWSCRKKTPPHNKRNIEIRKAEEREEPSYHLMVLCR